MKVNEIIQIMEKHYPLEIQEEWDRCGLQVGDRNQEVNKIMIALNADSYTLQEAIDHGCNMLITHHPFLLDKFENIDRDHFMGDFIYKAIDNKISVYSAHTSLDKVSMNNWLIEKLDVEDIENGEASGVSKMATLKEPLLFDDFINKVKMVYENDHIKYAGKVEKISKVAICGGSGAEYLKEYVGKVDAYITGDTKYPNAKYAFDHHILLVDIGHHAESIMISKLKELLSKEIDLEIIESQAKDYYSYE